jgi:ZIP family zinc transporter
VLEAAGWGLVGGASLLIGAAIGIAIRCPGRVVGLVLAFGAGTLVSALTFELTDEAYALGARMPSRSGSRSARSRSSPVTP